MTSGRKPVRGIFRQADKTQAVGVDRLLAEVRRGNGKANSVSAGKNSLPKNRVFVLKEGVQNIHGAKGPTHEQISLKNGLPKPEREFFFLKPKPSRPLQRRMPK